MINPKMGFVYHVVIFLVTYSSFETHSAKVNWEKHLIRYLITESYKSEVNFISDCKIEIQKIEHSAQAIARNFPSHVTVYHENHENLNYKLGKPCFKNPRATTLFIMIPSSEKRLMDLTKLITHCSSVKTRPQILVLFTSQQSSNFEKLLRRLWTRNFLDVTILELTETSLNSSFAKKPRPAAILHMFNPFTGVYSKNELLPKTQWLPNKLQDLNGYQLKTGLYENSPETDGEMQSLKILSEKMNFSIEPVTSDETEFGITDCDKEKNTGLMYNVSHSQVDFIANHVDGQSECDLELIESSMAIQDLPLSILVPILINRTFTLTGLVPFLYTFLIIATIVTTIPILSYLMKFETLTNPLTIVQVMIAQPLEDTPRKLKEMIIFGSILLFCAVFSTMIYEAAVNITFQAEDTVKLETLQDIEDSDVVPLLHPDWPNVFSENSDETLSRFFNRSVISPDIVDENCAREIKENGSIVCIMDEIYAKAMILKYRDQSGNPRMKVARDILMLNFYFLYFAPASPYVERFDDVLLRMARTGFFTLWRKQYLHKTVLISIKDGLPPPDSQIFVWERMKVHRTFYLILIFGYSVSVIAFLCEIVFKKISTFKCLK